MSDPKSDGRMTKNPYPIRTDYKRQKSQSQKIQESTQHRYKKLCDLKAVCGEDTMFESFWVRYEDPYILDEELMIKRKSDIHIPISDRRKINITICGIEYDAGRSIRDFKGSNMPIKYRLVSNDIDIDMGYTINSRISSKDRPNLTIRAGTIALFSGVMLAHKFVENFIDSVCGTAVRNTLSEIHVFMDINIPMERFFAYCRKKQHKGYLKPEGVFGGGAFGGDTSANNSGSGTIYIGRKGDISIRIYDKNAELSKKGMESMQKKEAYINRYGAIPDPWTRIEIRIKRRYLRENGAGIGPIDTVWDWQLHKGKLIEYIMTHTFRFVESDFKTTMPEWRWSMDKFVQYSNDDNASRDIHALQAMSAVWRNDIGKNMNIKSIAAQAIGSLQSVLIKCLDMPGNSHNDLLAGLKYILAEYFPIGSPSFKRLTFKGERKTNVKNANFSTENIQQIAQQPRKPNNAL